MAFITIFTPTYNRAYCLETCYRSLQRQTNINFKWLIVDDGSTDHTQEVVKMWQTEKNDFSISYVYKTNEGLYSGYTTAFKYIDTELCMCVDSDDYLTDNAIELIENSWNQADKVKYAGVIGLDCTEEGTIIGDRFPDQKTINLIDVAVGKYKYKNGDRKLAVRTDLYKQVVPFDNIPGEKDFNPHFLHLAISKRYDFVILNEPLCVVRYQSDGMTATVYKQYLRSPNSFRIMRQMDLSLPGSQFFLAKKTVHYVSSCILSRETCLKGTPHKLLAVLLYPVGYLFTVFLKWNVKCKKSSF